MKYVKFTFPYRIEPGIQVRTLSGLSFYVGHDKTAIGDTIRTDAFGRWVNASDNLITGDIFLTGKNLKVCIDAPDYMVPTYEVEDWVTYHASHDGPFDPGTGDDEEPN